MELISALQEYCHEGVFRMAMHDSYDHDYIASMLSVHDEESVIEAAAMIDPEIMLESLIDNYPNELLELVFDMYPDLISEALEDFFGISAEDYMNEISGYYDNETYNELESRLLDIGEPENWTREMLLSDHHIYGSERLGVVDRDLLLFSMNIDGGNASMTLPSAAEQTRNISYYVGKDAFVSFIEEEFDTTTYRHELYDWIAETGSAAELLAHYDASQLLPHDLALTDTLLAHYDVHDLYEYLRDDDAQQFYDLLWDHAHEDMARAIYKSHTPLYFIGSLDPQIIFDMTGEYYFYSGIADINQFEDWEVFNDELQIHAGLSYKTNASIFSESMSQHDGI